MRKDRLKAKLLRLRAKAQSLDSRCAASTDATEVRMLTEQRAEVQADIDDVTAELAEIEADEQRSAVPTASTAIPASAQAVNGNITASFSASPATTARSNENPFESMEYREAFMAYVQRGVKLPAEIVSRCNDFRNSLPAEQRSGVAITTVDTGAAIPLTVMREVINTVRKRYGNLYNAVRKTAIAGGVEYPIGALSASFKWISESAVSPNQKTDALGKVQFAYHTAEIRIAQSFLSQLLTITDFEAKLVEVIVVAYLEAMDYAIVNGTGDGMPLGILNDARVTNTVTLTAADMSNWTAWRKKFFSKLPLGYRDGEFIFPLSTVESYLETMADANNNPIFRQATGLEVNDGDALDPNGRFFGRRISLVEPNILPDFDTANANDIIGIYWQPQEYAINENFGFTMRRYFDETTNEWVDKALVVVDGKVLNPTGYVLIKKGS
jgi:HK97 family phage major capsid protein